MAEKKKLNPRMMRLIRVGINVLGLQEEEYRKLYEDVTGKRSLKELKSDKDLWRILDELKRRGFTPGADKYQGVTLDKKPLAKKVRSLWLTLRDMGVLRDPSEKALLNYIKKRTGRERMEWLADSQFVYIIESLKKWIAREDAALAQKRQAV